jgi:hypothetical protein
MDKNQPAKIVSMESNIEEVKQLRDNRIKSLLRTPDLAVFLAEYYNTFAFSPLKLEFLKRDLKELLQSPLDLVHYSASLRQINESDDRSGCFYLIEQEIRKRVEKYGVDKP